MQVQRVQKHSQHKANSFERIDNMKQKTYNNVVKVTKMIQKKGYSLEEANEMTIRLFDEHTKDMNDIEFYIDKILDKEEWERENKVV